MRASLSGRQGQLGFRLRQLRGLDLDLWPHRDPPGPGDTPWPIGLAGSATVTAQFQLMILQRGQNLSRLRRHRRPAPGRSPDTLEGNRGGLLNGLPAPFSPSRDNRRSPTTTHASAAAASVASLNPMAWSRQLGEVASEATPDCRRATAHRAVSGQNRPQHRGQRLQHLQRSTVERLLRAAFQGEYADHQAVIRERHGTGASS